MCVHTTTEQLRNPKESSSCHSLKTQHLLFLRRELSGGCRYGHPVKKCSVLAVGRTARSVRKARLPPSSSSGASTCWGRRRGAPPLAPLAPPRALPCPPPWAESLSGDSSTSACFSLGLTCKGPKVASSAAGVVRVV